MHLTNGLPFVITAPKIEEERGTIKMAIRILKKGNPPLRFFELLKVILCFRNFLQKKTQFILRLK